MSPDATDPPSEPGGPKGKEPAAKTDEVEASTDLFQRPALGAAREQFRRDLASAKEARQRAEAEFGTHEQHVEALKAGADPETTALLAARAELGQILDDVAAFLGRFVVFPSEGARFATTLWVAHAHCPGAFDTTPRLCALSPEKRSGKTRLLEVLELLTPTARHAVNISAAALFRMVATMSPTLLWDEADTFFGPRAASNYEELRGLVNAGYRKGATAWRCVGVGEKAIEPKEFPAFCVIAMAGIGDLPDTILDRAVLLRMRRRSPGEPVERFRRRDVTPPGRDLHGRLATWAKAAEGELSERWPEFPEGLSDRDEDTWEPLLAIADLADGPWPERARRAARELVAEREQVEPSRGVRLLKDVHTCFGDLDRLTTEELLDRLHKLEESPWGDLRGKPLDARGLARRLKPYGVRPHNVRFHDDSQAKGYERADFTDAWSRYLALSAESPSQASQPSQAHPDPSEDPHPSQVSLPLTRDGTAGTDGTDRSEIGSRRGSSSVPPAVPGASEAVPEDPDGSVTDLGLDQLDDLLAKVDVEDAPVPTDADLDRSGPEDP